MSDLHSTQPASRNSRVSVTIWTGALFGFLLWQSVAQQGRPSACMNIPLISGECPQPLGLAPEVGSEDEAISPLENQEKESFSKATPKPDPLYTFKKDHHWDGIGKFYMGREISHVMGHQGAGWLERDSREEEEKPVLLIDALDLKPGMVVADIGAGTGYYSRRLAEKVGKEGKVYGVDIQPEMLELLARNAKAADLPQIIPVKGKIDDPNLPEAALDVIIMVDVYHEFSHPYEMTAKLCQALKTGGRLVFVEYRLEDPNVPIKTLHKMSEAQVKKEAEPHPLKWVKTYDKMPWQHVIIFEKLSEASQKNTLPAEAKVPGE